MLAYQCAISNKLSDLESAINFIETAPIEPLGSWKVIKNFIFSTSGDRPNEITNPEEQGTPVDNADNTDSIDVLTPLIPDLTIFKRNNKLNTQPRVEAIKKYLKSNCAIFYFNKVFPLGRIYHK
jgi:hypothetical protein